MNSFDIYVYKYCNYWVDINVKLIFIIEVYVVIYKIWIWLLEILVIFFLLVVLFNFFIVGLFQFFYQYVFEWIEIVLDCY